MASKVQTGIRLDEEFYNKVKAVASLECRTVNNMIEYIIRRYIADYEAAHGPIPEYEDD